MHIAQKDCLCQPYVESVDPMTREPYHTPICVHHAWDGREKRERVNLAQRYHHHAWEIVENDGES